MKAIAEWLKAHPAEKIRIEGNCDVRGTKEYNVALGQRRAATAKKYLSDLGIAPREYPCSATARKNLSALHDNEACWQKDRRDDFFVASP